MTGGYTIPAPPMHSRRPIIATRLPPHLADKSPAAHHSGHYPKQAQVALDDVVQMSDKTAEVTPTPCVARVASSDTDISILTDRMTSWLGK